MLLSKAIDDFLSSLEADGLSAATVKWYRSLLKAFDGAAPGELLADIDADFIRIYIAILRDRKAYEGAPQKPRQRHNLAVASVDSHLRALHAFWLWCTREYHIANPMQNIRRPKLREPVVKAIDHADFVRLFEATAEGAIGTRDRALLSFLADTGARRAGIWRLKWSDVDLDLHRAQVLEKGSKPRKVVFTQVTAGFLAAWRFYAPADAVYVFVSSKPPFARLSPDGIRQILDRLKRKAGVEGRVNPHSFRHNFAREYLRNGGDIVSLARLLGHKDINVTSSYYAIFSQDELAELHEKYSPLKEMLK